MRVAFASEAAPDRPENEDAALHLGSLVGVFDGVTKPRDTETGCLHTPAWYVRRLTLRLRQAFEESPDDTLAGGLASAIARVREDHGGRCDLANPATPAAAVCLLRANEKHVEYLILSDCTLVIDRGAVITKITDERFSRTIAQLRHKARANSHDVAPVLGHTPGKYTMINRPEGYWIAAANPEAAHEAITGTFDLSGSSRVRRAALLTDGAACAVDMYHIMSWSQLLDALDQKGPTDLIRQVRLAENADPASTDYPRFKRHDDATAALCLFEEPS